MHNCQRTFPSWVEPGTAPSSAPSRAEVRQERRAEQSKMDAARQEFPGDAEANRLVDRARREPWQI